MTKDQRIAQMTANAKYLLHSYGILPFFQEFPVIAQVDHTFYKARQGGGHLGFFDCMRDMVAYDEFRWWNLVQNHGTTAEFGWREYVPRYSMQLIWHSTGLLEVDFDYYNPQWGDVWSFLGHSWEVITPGKTNSFKVLEGLRKRGFRIRDVREDL